MSSFTRPEGTNELDARGGDDGALRGLTSPQPSAEAEAQRACSTSQSQSETYDPYRDYRLRKQRAQLGESASSSSSPISSSDQQQRSRSTSQTPLFSPVPGQTTASALGLEGTMGGFGGGGGGMGRRRPSSSTSTLGYSRGRNVRLGGGLGSIASFNEYDESETEYGASSVFSGPSSSFSPTPNSPSVRSAVPSPGPPFQYPHQHQNLQSFSALYRSSPSSSSPSPSPYAYGSPSTLPARGGISSPSFDCEFNRNLNVNGTSSTERGRRRSFLSQSSSLTGLGEQTIEQVQGGRRRWEEGVSTSSSRRNEIEGVGERDKREKQQHVRGSSKFSRSANIQSTLRADSYDSPLRQYVRFMARLRGPSLSSTQTQGTASASASPARSGLAKYTLLIGLLFVLLIKWLIGLGGYSGRSTPPRYGDFEAQRHWMALSANLPLGIDWYQHGKDWWQLDYPPLTILHSYICGKIGGWFLPDSFSLDSRGSESPALTLFMRASVIASELLVWFPVVIAYVWLTLRDRSRRTRIIGILSILLYPGLILIDNGHFQFNSVMLGLTLGSILAFQFDYDVVGCVAFSLSLGFKQMALYYSPAVFAYLLGKCFYLGGRDG